MTIHNDALTACSPRSSWPTSKVREASFRPPFVRVKNPLLQMAWVEFLGGVPWEWFVTLTFDAKKVRSMSRQTASREAVRWCGDIERCLRRSIGWLIALERHKSGRWHAHALLAGLPPGIPLDHFAALWEHRNGRVDLRSAGDPTRRCLYLTKEAAADGELLLSDGVSRFREASTSRIGAWLYPAHCAHDQARS